MVLIMQCVPVEFIKGSFCEKHKVLKMLKKKGRASLKIKKCVFEKNPNQVCALRALEEG